MVLRMACPTKRSGSDKWYYRRKIPADARAILAKLPKEQHPPGWYKEHISISLGTADRDAAKAKCGEVAAVVERHLKALREGPKALNAKQIASLSGIAYRAFTETLEDNPGLTVEGWLRVAKANEAAKRGNPLLIAKNDTERQAISMEKRFGPLADATLLAEGLVTDDDSRWKLIEALARDLTPAAKKLARNADADFSPDTYVTRFPAPTEAKPSEQADRSLTGLADAWHKAALERDMRRRDADRIKRRFEMLIAFLRHDDTRRVTKQDIIRWRDHRLANKISVKTINDSDIASFSNVFNWGVDRGWLDANPTDKATIKAMRKKAKLREEFFTRDETAKILAHAKAATGSRRENPKTTAARRWVPWLCAYSGARVAEMIQLRKQDVRKDHEHGWVIRLTPEAGSIKNNKFCDVPVHEHLVATGFIDFVNGAKPGHLFCNLGEDGTIEGTAGGVYSRVREWVREAVKDENVAPNHAWRYTFKSYGLEAGIEALTLDAISNYSPRTQGEAYTKVTLKARADAMAKFPRYSLRQHQPTPAGPMPAEA